MTDTPIGSKVYDGEGNEIGTVKAHESGTLYVSTGEGEGAAAHDRVDGRIGEGELAWRCSRCGEMGMIDDMPDGCPGCDAPKTELYYTTED